ncbi:MAG: PAAR domain-containing protein [Aquabacterium sp.]
MPHHAGLEKGAHRLIVLNQHHTPDILDNAIHAAEDKSRHSYLCRLSVKAGSHATPGHPRGLLDAPLLKCRQTYFRDRQVGRPFIVLGDQTDHGGQVIAASVMTDTHGKGIARVGDQVTCPKRNHGTTVIVTGYPMSRAQAGRPRSTGRLASSFSRTIGHGMARRIPLVTTSTCGTDQS